MRLPQLLLYCILLMILMTGSVLAQTPPAYRDCTDLSNNESVFDIIRFEDFYARPGDTAWLPVYIEHDLILQAFQILLKWDDTKISPVVEQDILIPDLYHVQYELVGEFADLADSALALDPFYNIFQASISLNPIDTGAILAGFNLSSSANVSPLTMPPGGRIMFKIPFVSNFSMADGDSTLIRFFAINPAYIDSSGNPALADCRRSDFAVLIIDGGIPQTVYPTSDSGYFHADATPPPVINVWSSNPSDTVVLGNSSILTWDISNTDSVYMSGPGLDQITTDSTGNLFVQATSLGVQTYTLETWNIYDTVSSQLSFYVKSGGGDPDPDNDPPIVSAPQSNYGIDEGQTLSFVVSATDPDNDQITLTASNLPPNATFTSAVNVGSVSSTFSFSPDFGQAGTYQISFSASDGKTSRTAIVTISVAEIQFDRLFTTSDAGQAPVGGMPGKESILLPINLITQQTCYGVQFDFSYNYQYFTVDSVLVTPRISEYVVYDNIGQIPGEVLVMAFGLANEPVVTDTASSAILNMVMSVDSSAPAGDYPVYISNGWESINPDPNFPSLPLVTDSGLIQVDTAGDVNLDKIVNVGDAVSIVAYIIGNFGLTDRQFDVADIIRDNFVNVFDLVGVINTVFGYPLEPSSPLPGDQPATIALVYNDIEAGSNDILTISSEMPTDVAGVELDLIYDPGVVTLGRPVISEDAAMMNLSYRDDKHGRLKVLLHFTSPTDPNAVITEGAADLVQIPIIARSEIAYGDKSQLRLGNALVSTPTAAALAVEGIDPGPQLPTSFALSQNYPNPFNPTTIISFQLVDPNQQVRLDIFNVLGQQVSTLINSNLAAGAYDIEWDATNERGRRVATGIYLYRLQVDENTQTKKMLFLK